ncbi:MAG TPA: hypothetical protein VID04_08775, partial [Methylomirabilota bacterium]|jgi:hypothetical protein
MARVEDLRTREFTILGQDPAVRTRAGKIVRARVAVPAEKLEPGPRGYRVSVVDYDSSADILYEPADLDDGAGTGDRYSSADDDRLLNDPGFHAQNVYALVMQSLARFEAALGRHISWSFLYGHQLQVAPHAFREANAYYTELDQGLLFGYFPGQRGHTIFTCLSHDVVVHETSHALLDSLRDRYTDPSVADQAAFHEAFADLAALLSVFSVSTVVGELIRRSIPSHSTTARRVDEAWLRRSALFGLAEEMGQELQTNRGRALRSSLEIKPGPHVLERSEFQLPHRRGEILVAATLAALVRTWARRLEDLGAETIRGADPRAIRRIAEEGAAGSAYLLTLAIRALDYAPPIDLLFGDFLSAMLTADAEISPQERRFKYREELLGSFGEFGIAPASDAAGGLWQPPDADPHIEDKRPLVYDRVHFESLRQDPDEVFRFLWENRTTLGLYPGTYTRVMSVRPCVRVAPDGFVLRETVAEWEQMMDVRAAELRRLGLRAPRGMSPGTLLRLHGGGTLIFDEFGKLKFNVHKRLIGRGQQQKLDYLWAHGGYRADAAQSRKVAPGGYFANLHRQRAL